MDEREAFVGVHEAAQVINCSPGWVRMLCRQGKIPHYQPQPYAHYRFLVSELKAWLRGEWSRDE